MQLVRTCTHKIFGVCRLPHENLQQCIRVPLRLWAGSLGLEPLTEVDLLVSNQQFFFPFLFLRHVSSPKMGRTRNLRSVTWRDGTLEMGARRHAMHYAVLQVQRTIIQQG